MPASEKEKIMSNTGNRQREFDVVVWGATGFTGRLVAGYLAEEYGVDKDLRWAIAGRNPERLKQVRKSLGKSAASLPLIIADSHDADSLAHMVERSRVVCSTVGPFALYGSELVAACATRGTDYCDITGEAHWIRAMIDAHEEKSRKSGARIVNCCGFDSLPSDLGTWFVQQAMKEQYGVSASEVAMRVRRMKGKFSGGTAASMLAAFEAAAGDKSVRRALGHPYSLNPVGEQKGPPSTDPQAPRWDEDVKSWIAPFIMANINTKIVRRSNALLNWAYGRNFRYSEAMMTGAGPAGFARAAMLSASLGGFVGLAALPPTRALLSRFFLPQPGEGPTRQERERGMFDILLVAHHPESDDISLTARVTADRDPGYGATCRMLGESAVGLALDSQPRGMPGGFWTPAAAMGQQLIDRLCDKAGMSFSLLPRQSGNA
jgi:short subunit dehydrogenase-like uncharacterized protein